MSNDIIELDPMRHFVAANADRITRLFEILIPLTSWLIITMPLWLSLWHPALVAYIIITFDVYWFYKSFTLVLYAVRSFVTFTAHTNLPWGKMAETCPNYEKCYHVVIIPQYKEPIHILRRTLQNLTKQDFPKSRIIIVLGCEEKDGNAKEVSSILTKEFSHSFHSVITTYHPLIVGEIAGKSSNMAYAAKKAVEFCEEKRISLEYTTVTSCDADAIPHPKYFSYLAHEFLTDPDRYVHFYQGAILFYNNIWRIPLPNRFLNTINSIWNLAVLSQKHKLINFSTYSLSLKTAKEIGYWATDVIPEDYHMFFKLYFARGESVMAKPLFLPILVDAAESTGVFKTFVNQYEQSKRWAWGVSDIPYVIKNTLIHSEIPFSDRSRRLLDLLEHHIFWPANWFLLTLGSALPPIVNPIFARTVLGHNLAQISSGILTISTVFLIVVFVIDWRIKPPPPDAYPKWKLPLLYLQWLTLPVISFFLSALPGLDAHTRLMLGKRLEYRVTEKV